MKKQEDLEEGITNESRHHLLLMGWAWASPTLVWSTRTCALTDRPTDRPTDRVRSSLIPSPSPQLSSLAVRITRRSFSASDDSCGEGLGTRRLCSSHSRDTDMLHVPMLPCSCAWWQCVVVKTENANDGKAKSRDTHATNCETGTRETSEPLHTCASLLVSPSLAFTYVTFSCRSLHTKPFSHFST